jgi:ABC-type nitrate/sulfonate/bicarbonate transport system substrate-binding protein
MTKRTCATGLLAFAVALAGCGSGESAPARGAKTLCLGYFANVTHAPAIVGAWGFPGAL